MLEEPPGALRQAIPRIRDELERAGGMNQSHVRLCAYGAVEAAAERPQGGSVASYFVQGQNKRCSATLQIPQQSKKRHQPGTKGGYRKLQMDHVGAPVF